MEIMKPHEIIEELKQKGIVCSLDGDSLKFSGKRKNLTPTLEEILTSNKESILQYLVAQKDGPVLRTVLADEGWPPELVELIAWVWLAELPNKAFQLKNGVQVNDVRKFYRGIGEMIVAGPNSHFVLFNELSDKLKLLRSSI